MIDWIEAAWKDAPPWVELGIECATAIVIGLAIHHLLDRLFRRLSADYPLARNLLRFGRRPGQVLLPLLLLQIAINNAADYLFLIAPLRHVLTIALIVTATVLCIRLIKAISQTVIDAYPFDHPDNLRARAVRTQTRVLGRTAMFIVGLIGTASLLMTFPGVRQIGASLLASAGVAGLVAGIAARPVLGSLIAGLQIALTQPIRIDDVVIIEGEWGRIEEITSTYVVVKIWDERRLVVPLEWFIQNPFQNWTRRSSDLIGTVFLWVDYRMPLEPLRAELERVCEAAPEWDRRVCGLQVTEANERAIQLRVLVSAPDASKTWDLRCKVREALVAFIQRDYADYLPRVRGSLENASEPTAHGVAPALASART